VGTARELYLCALSICTSTTPTSVTMNQLIVTIETCESERLGQEK
jgi:hypothetical protein